MVSLSITQKIPDVFNLLILRVYVRTTPCSEGQSRYERSLLLSCGLLEPNPDKPEIRSTKFETRNKSEILNFQMFKTITLLLDMAFAFMSFEFGKFGHCFGFRYSDFEFNILIFI